MRSNLIESRLVTMGIELVLEKEEAIVEAEEAKGKKNGDLL